jgi:two-component system, OmpR family, phosphate regulon response regulator PhoB
MGTGVIEARTVAISAATPALTALLGAVLASDSRLRARTFDTAEELTAYLRLIPADIVVLDLDLGDEAAALAESIRCDADLASRGTHIIALSRTVSAWTKGVVVRAGIDEVLIKPMSPRYLLERVRALAMPPHHRVGLANGYLGPERRNRLALPLPQPFAARRVTDNVVPLFPRREAAAGALSRV